MAQYTGCRRLVSLHLAVAVIVLVARAAALLDVRASLLNQWVVELALVLLSGVGQADSAEVAFRSKEAGF